MCGICREKNVKQNEKKVLQAVRDGIHAADDKNVVQYDLSYINLFPLGCMLGWQECEGGKELQYISHWHKYVVI